VKNGLFPLEFPDQQRRQRSLKVLHLYHLTYCL
jgi:hypothetical protein